MSSFKHHGIPRLLTILVCCSGAAVGSHSVVAAERPVTTMTTLTQTGRYSVMAAQPTTGQRDLLSVTRAITIPGDIDKCGGGFPLDVARFRLSPGGRCCAVGGGESHAGAATASGASPL